MAKQLRIDSQWTERSADDWNLEHFENERKKLYEVLEDEEDIEFLINGDCILVDEGRNNIPGGAKKWGVIAATGRRLVYVYISKEGALLSELSYNNIEELSQNNYPALLSLDGRQPHPRLSRRSGNPEPFIQ